MLAFRSIKTWCAFFIGVVCLCLSFQSQVVAQQTQQTIKLRVGGPHVPESAPWVRFIQDIFIPDIKADAGKLGYNIEFVETWGGTVTKMNETSTTIQGRILDISYITFPAEASRFPLHNFNYWVPFGNSDPLITFKASKAVYEEFPILTQTLERRFGQKFLAITTVQDYGIVSTFPIKGISDLKGRKLGGIGPMLDYVRFANGVPVNSGMPEMYMSAQSGVTEGHMILPQAIVGAKMWEVAKYWTITQFGSACPQGLSINMDTWKSLPAPVQAIVQKAADRWAESLAKNAKDTQDADLKKWRESGGMVYELTQSEKEKWAALFPNNYVAEKIKKVNDAGLPGTKVLESYLKNLEKLGYVSPRKWVLE